jgi:3-deoxy-7-phosphoheptulonate synthase
MINAIGAVQHPQVYIGRDNRSRYTTGNPYAHAILRGANLDDGTFDPNYHHEDILNVISLGKKKMLKNFGVIIDCNHANSGKKPFDQYRIMKSVMSDMEDNAEIRSHVKGFMIEGYMLGGSQTVVPGDKYTPGLSITDPCQSWDDSKEGIGTKNTLIEMNELYGKMKK